uniref:Amidase domain-containing protein n=1 Tax=Oryza punctata TaxID=4537 RepID=A0A0E0MCW8_ORYPU
MWYLIAKKVCSFVTDSETQGTATAKSLNEKLVLETVSDDSSTQHCQSPQPEVFTNIRDEDMQDSVKSLSEKLASALLTINAKEDLVKQHTKVAEEAVAGWEQAEAEVSALKRLLEVSTQKNASLDDQVNHLDDALKECVRQLRQAREEQEEKIRDAVAKKTQELDSEKSELQNHISELKQQLEAAKLEAATVAVQHDLQDKLQVAEKENKGLKIELLTLAKDLKRLSLERDLSNEAAETASKQHLESVKKIARVEAECRKLRHLTRRTSLANDSRPAPNNVCMESLTDSQSDSGERMLAVDSEMRNSDSWASALIAELDQFKNSSASSRDVVNNHVEIDLMDDFLEMEKLAALSEVEHVSSSFETETDSDQAVAIDKASKVKTETLKSQVTVLQAKVEKLETEKRDLEMALAEARVQLDASCDALMAANNKLAELQMQFNSANESKIAALGQADQLDAERGSLALQLESKSIEVEKLQAVVASLEESADKKDLESQLESTSVELADLRKTVASLQEQIEAERTLSLQHKAYADMADADKESLEAQLQSAHADIGKLRGSIETLKSELQKEKTMYEELVVQMESMKIESEKKLGVESAKEALEARLLVVNSEIAKLHGTVNDLECDAAKEKAFSSELKMQLEAVEGIRKMLESELESSHQETMKLQEKISSLEVRLKDQTALLVEFTAKAEDAAAGRKAMEGQLEGAKLEITKLTNRVSLLQGKIEQEKLLSEEYEAKCRKLEAQLSRDSREAKLWRLANTNGDLKVKQDKELSSAAGKLAECQKTIANLGRQLKSLTDLDGVTAEPEKLDSGDTLLDFRDNDVEVPPADFADGLYDLDLPKSNGSCLSPIPHVQPSSTPSQTSAPKVYKPASEVNLGPDSNEFYISPNVKAPRVAGFLVKMFAWVLEAPIIGSIVLYILKRDNLVNKLVSDAEIPEPPLFTAAHTWQDIPEQNVSLTKPDMSPAERVQEAVVCLPARLESALADPLLPRFRRLTIRDFTSAYISGEITPVMVVRRFLAAVKECSGPDLNMALFISCNPQDIIRQAEASTLRYQQGAPLSAMDGVLVAVKDEIDCLPYPTTGGTRWLQRMRPCVQDAAVVAQLRACGAVLAGKTNMHELGAGTSGINPHHGSTRNPYNTGKVAGGSSGGSAAVVCAGLCPVALGADGGGSVRMPAALCGVVGLKPTAGRFSKDGFVMLHIYSFILQEQSLAIAAMDVHCSDELTHLATSGFRLLPLNWTVGMPGILAATVEDALIALPELNLPLLKAASSMPIIRLARYAKWFNDCSEDIRSCCDKAVHMLRTRHGWETADVTIPEIEEMRLAHYVTMGSECTASFDKYLKKLSKSEIGWDVRIALSAYGSFSSRAYLNSQRIRNRQMYFHDKIFGTFDAIVTPMTGCAGAVLDRREFPGVAGDHREGWEACGKSYRKPMVYYDLLNKNKY